MAFSSMFKRMGTKQVKVTFVIEIESVSIPMVRGLAPGDLILVSFERGSKSVETQEYAVGDLDKPMGQLVTPINEVLSLPASLYKNSNGKLQEKTGTLTVKQRKSGVSGKKAGKDAYKTIGVVPLELHELAGCEDEEISFPLAWCIAEGATLTARITAKSGDEDDDNSSVSTASTSRAKPTNARKSKSTDDSSVDTTKDKKKAKSNEKHPKDKVSSAGKKSGLLAEGESGDEEDDADSYQQQLQQTPSTKNDKNKNGKRATDTDWIPDFSKFESPSNPLDPVSESINGFGDAQVNSSTDWGDPFSDSGFVAASATPRTNGLAASSAVTTTTTSATTAMPGNDDPFATGQNSFGSPAASASSALSTPMVTPVKSSISLSSPSVPVIPPPIPTPDSDSLSAAEKMKRAKEAASVGVAGMVASKAAQQTKQNASWQQEIAELKQENASLRERAEMIEIMTMKADFFAKESARLDESLIAVIREREQALARKREAEIELAKREQDNAGLLEELLTTKTSLAELTSQLEDMRNEGDSLKRQSEDLMSKLSSLEVMIAESAVARAIPPSDPVPQGRIVGEGAVSNSVNPNGAASLGKSNPFNKMTPSAIKLAAANAFSGAVGLSSNNQEGGGAGGRRAGAAEPPPMGLQPVKRNPGGFATTIS